MSVRVSDWVWRESGAKGNDLLLLLALADQSDDKGRCWPSVQHLADKTRLSRATVQRRLHALRDSGLITTEARAGGSNLYHFTFAVAIPDVDVVPQNAAPNLPHPEGGLNLRPASPNEAGGASPTDAGGASPGEALTVNEPSMNRQSSKPRKRNTTIPDSFNFGDVADWTAKSGLPVDASDFEHFRDHHTAKGSVMKDWHAAWRTWARNSRKFSGGKQKLTRDETVLAWGNLAASYDQKAIEG